MFPYVADSIFYEEGGYVNDPSDSGGATNRGITQNTYDLYRRSRSFSVRSVLYCTKLEAIYIYDGIWHDCKADQLPLSIAFVHFDFAVNSGDHQAALILQRSIGVTDDGIIGPETLAAVKAAQEQTVVSTYSDLRRKFLTSLATKRPKDSKFLKGWLARVDRVEAKALKLIKNNGIITTESS